MWSVLSKMLLKSLCRRFSHLQSTKMAMNILQKFTETLCRGELSESEHRYNLYQVNVAPGGYFWLKCSKSIGHQNHQSLQVPTWTSISLSSYMFDPQILFLSLVDRYLCWFRSPSVAFFAGTFWMVKSPTARDIDPSPWVHPAMAMA